MKTILLLYFTILFSMEVIYSQEKNFELNYDISAWYEHEETFSSSKKTNLLNNNIKIAYYLKPFLSFGLSTNFYYKKDKSKIGYITTPDRNYYDIVSKKYYEIGTGPYAKISFGKNFKFFLTVEYNYSYGKDTLLIFNEINQTYQSGQSKYITQCFVTELGVGKKISNSLYLNLFFRQKYVFVYEHQPKDSGGRFNPFFQSFIGLGITYNFNLQNKEK